VALDPSSSDWATTADEGGNEPVSSRPDNPNAPAVGKGLAGKFKNASGLRGNVVGPALADRRPKEATVPERGGAKVAEVDLRPPEGLGE